MMPDDEQDIAADLAYVAHHPEQFTKEEMAAMLAEAAKVIASLRSLIEMRADMDLEDIEPEGNA